MSLTRVAVVPSLFQSSLPWVASEAVKKTFPPTATGVPVRVALKSIGVRLKRARPSRFSTWSRKLGFLLGAADGEERRLVNNLMLHLSSWKRKPTRRAGEKRAQRAEHRRPEARLRSSNFGV